MDLARFRRIFLSPSYRISDPISRARAEVFVSLLIFRQIVIVTIMLFLLRSSFNEFANFVPVALLNLVAYFGSRTRYIRWAACAIIVEPILSIPIMEILQPGEAFGPGGPAWMILGPLLGGLILTPWYNMMVIGGSIASYITLLLTASTERLPLLINQFVLFISVSVLSIMYGFLRQRIDTGMAENRAVNLHSAKLESLGEMAGGVAHELNSPLAAISLNLEMIEEDLNADKEANAEALEKLRSIAEITAKMATVINGLRAFAREGETTEQKTLPAADWIDRSLGLCQRRIHNSGVDLKVNRAGFETMGYVQSVQLSQALLNLLNNSFEAVSKLEHRWIQLEARRDGRFFELRVTDSGRGLQKPQLTKVFQPFYTTKSIGAGAGLGLSVAKGILENHGGQIFYDESQAHTSFVLRLPVASQV